MNQNKKLSVLLCKPTFFDVFYEINAWMHTDNAVDVELAKRQWQTLVDGYEQKGYDIAFIDPVDGLPDMVFTANGALVHEGKVALPRFKFAERQPETALFQTWFTTNYPKHQLLLPEHNFEGEGDAMFANGVLYAGHGYRSDKASHEELAKFFDVEVRTLDLIDDRFYHLDTCLSIIDKDTIAYFPAAFSIESRKLLEKSFHRTIHVGEQDAAGFGLNMVSNGMTAFVSAQAPDLQRQIADFGLDVESIDVSEFKKSGGGIKCMTLFLDQPHS